MNNATAISIENNSGMPYTTLIPVRLGELGGEVVQLCNAKDVFICLGVRSRFNDWIARRVEEYGFVEGQDFYSEVSKKTKGQRGRSSIDYSLSVDMAKELAMVERTEAGRRIRRYFIDCEKRLRQIAPESAAEALRKALSPEQQHALSGKVHSKVACLEKARQRAGYSELWSSLKAKHQVARYQDIAQGEFDDACTFVDSYVWEGEFFGKRGSRALDLDSKDLVNLYALCTHANRILCRWQTDLGPALRSIRSPLAEELHDHVVAAGLCARSLGKMFSSAPSGHVKAA